MKVSTVEKEFFKVGSESLGPASHKHIKENRLPGELYIEIGNIWVKKFAYLPINTVSKKLVFLKTYYAHKILFGQILELTNSIDSYRIEIKYYTKHEYLIGMIAR